MHYVTIPEPIDVAEADPVGTPPARPKIFLQSIIIGDLCASLSWRENDSKMASCLAIVDAFKPAKAGDVIPMTDEDRENLVNVFRSYPGWSDQANAPPRAFLLPYILRLFRAVTSAPKEKP